MMRSRDNVLEKALRVAPHHDIPGESPAEFKG
jgi:hypothetical protein